MKRQPKHYWPALRVKNPRLGKSGIILAAFHDTVHLEPADQKPSYIKYESPAALIAAGWVAA